MPKRITDKSVSPRKPATSTRELTIRSLEMLTFDAVSKQDFSKFNTILKFIFL